MDPGVPARGVRGGARKGIDSVSGIRVDMV